MDRLKAAFVDDASNDSLNKSQTQQPMALKTANTVAPVSPPANQHPPSSPAGTHSADKPFATVSDLPEPVVSFRLLQLFRHACVTVLSLHWLPLLLADIHQPEL